MINRDLKIVYIARKGQNVMKKFLISIIAVIFVLGLVGCSSNKSLEIINTFEITPSNLVEEYVDNRPTSL